MRENCSEVKKRNEQLNEISPPTRPCSGPKIETRNNNNSDNLFKVSESFPYIKINVLKYSMIPKKDYKAIICD